MALLCLVVYSRGRRRPTEPTATTAANTNRSMVGGAPRTALPGWLLLWVSPAYGMFGRPTLVFHDTVGLLAGATCL
jgi:hypothetical protein